MPKKAHPQLYRDPPLTASDLCVCGKVSFYGPDEWISKTDSTAVVVDVEVVALVVGDDILDRFEAVFADVVFVVFRQSNREVVDVVVMSHGQSKLTDLQQSNMY